MFISSSSEDELKFEARCSNTYKQMNDNNVKEEGIIKLYFKGNSNSMEVNIKTGFDRLNSTNSDQKVRKLGLSITI